MIKKILANWKYLGKVIVISIILLFLIIGFLRFGTVWFLFDIWKSVALKLQENFHFHRYLTYALAVPLAIVFYKLIDMALFANKRKRWIAIYLFSGIMVICFIAMFSIQKDWVFDANNGTPLQCFARNPFDGKLELVPCSYNYHPVWGTKIETGTKELMQEYASQDEPLHTINRVLPNENTRFFTNDGTPLLWYYQRTSGKLEFYNHKGNHPQFANVVLTPVSTEIVQKLFKYLENGQDTMIIVNNSTTAKRINATIKAHHIGDSFSETSKRLKELIKDRK